MACERLTPVLKSYPSPIAPALYFLRDPHLHSIVSADPQHWHLCSGHYRRMVRTEAKGEKPSQLSPLPMSFFMAGSFAYRKSLPKMPSSLGIPFYYRAILLVASLFVMGCTMYAGYQSAGTGWLLAGLPFAFVFGILTQGIILRIFPPKLDAYAEGSTWLKL